MYSPYARGSSGSGSGGGSKSVVLWSVGSGVLAAIVATLVTLLTVFLTLKPDVDEAHDRLDVAITDTNTQNTRHRTKDSDQDLELTTLAASVRAVEARVGVLAAQQDAAVKSALDSDAQSETVASNLLSAVLGV